ncbi:MAG: protein-(glutamine-N5) methyltransferase, release factor-specific [Chloroflexi bacterium]|nr:protein-(glutamine-N5) methyltransferase, release factor-specific [Chloroflexota bacterium]
MRRNRVVKVKEILYAISKRLQEFEVPDSDLEAEILVRHTLKLDRETIFREFEKDLLKSEEQSVYSLLDKRLEGYPLSYITGKREFYGIDIEIGEGVLIPRQETEILVQTAITISKKMRKENIKIADIGTGSAAISIAIALNIPNSLVYACDISYEALEIATENINKYSLEDKILLNQGDLLEPILDEMDIILSNPPYIPNFQISSLPQEVLNEPRIALDGGKDGLQVISRLMKESVNKLSIAGAMVIEITPELSGKTVLLAREYFPEANILILKDLMENDRAILINRSSDHSDLDYSNPNW